MLDEEAMSRRGRRFCLSWVLSTVCLIRCHGIPGAGCALLIFRFREKNQ